MGTESLRTRQAALARQSIVETLVRHLEAGDADDISMDDLATEAGVSRRTLYRYFPARQDLLAASGDWIRDNLLNLPVEIGDEGLAESFRRASAQLESRPHLARALLRTETGRAVRSGYRKARVDAIRRALKREVPGLARRELDRAAGVFAYLCSSGAWTTIQDESELAASDAQAAVTWAIETLLESLRERAAAKPKGGKR